MLPRRVFSHLWGLGIGLGLGEQSGSNVHNAFREHFHENTQARSFNRSTNDTSTYSKLFHECLKGSKELRCGFIERQCECENFTSSWLLVIMMSHGSVGIIVTGHDPSPPSRNVHHERHDASWPVMTGHRNAVMTEVMAGHDDVANRSCPVMIDHDRS